MKARNLILGLVAGTAVALVAKKVMDGRMSAAEGASGDAVRVVQNVLHEHAGEDKPFVHAFEEALEQETRAEAQLAEEAGLRGA